MDYLDVAMLRSITGDGEEDETLSVAMLKLPLQHGEAEELSSDALQ